MATSCVSAAGNSAPPPAARAASAGLTWSRCGYAARLNSLTALAITKLDVLSGRRRSRSVRVTWATEGWRSTTSLPPDVLHHSVGHYVELPGCRGPHRVPQRGRAARERSQYLQFISDFVKVPIALVGVGPSRDQGDLDPRREGMYGSDARAAASQPVPRSASRGGSRRLDAGAWASASLPFLLSGMSALNGSASNSISVSPILTAASDRRRAARRPLLDLLDARQPLPRLLGELLPSLAVERECVRRDVRLLASKPPAAAERVA